MSAQNDSAFLRMALMVLGALVVFTVIILIAANMITGSVEEARGPDPRLRAAIAERIRPVGEVNVAAAAAEAAAPKSGADIVATACNACHLAGVLGAPKTGDGAAWSQRLAAEGGLDGLVASAIKGKNGMPPKGGAMVSDDEIRAAVEHLLSESGVDAGTTAAAPAAEPAAAEAPAAPADPVEAVQQMASDAVDTAQGMVAAMMPAATPEAVETAAPVAETAAPAADLEKGKAVYGAACFVCHMTGAAGAPKLGDKAAWEPRLPQGMDALVAAVINGKNAMPPKGGRMDLSDEDVAAAVAYMVSEAQ